MKTKKKSNPCYNLQRTNQKCAHCMCKKIATTLFWLPTYTTAVCDDHLEELIQTYGEEKEHPLC